MSGTRRSPALGYATIYCAVQRVTDRAAVKHWGTHDLRRTFISHLRGSGVPLSTVKKIVNHIETDVTSTRYDWNSYDAEKRMAAVRPRGLCCAVELAIAWRWPTLTRNCRHKIPSRTRPQSKESDPPGPKKPGLRISLYLLF